MKDIFFSIVVYVDQDETLERSLKSITSVSDDMASCIKIIVVDSLCSEISVEICNQWKEKYGKRNFCYIKAEGASIGEGYNKAIPEIRGKYVNFLLSSAWFQPGIIEGVYECAMELDRPKLISLTPCTINEKGENVTYQLAPKATSKGYEKISLEKQPARVQLCLHAYFIRCYIVTDANRRMSFNPMLHEDAVIEFLLNILKEYQHYIYLTNGKLHYTFQLEDNTSAFMNQHYAWWYTDSMKNWIIPFEKKCSEESWPINKSIRISLLWLIASRFLCNYNDRNKGVLSGADLNEFIALTGEALQYIDNELIWEKSEGQTFTIPRTLKILLLKIKAEEANCECEMVKYQNQICMWIHEKKDGEPHTQTLLSSLKVLPSEESLKNENKEIGYNTNLFTVERKENQVPLVRDAYNNMMFHKLVSLEKEHVLLKAINFQNGRLEIDGTFSMGDFLDRERLRLKLIKNGKDVISVPFSEIYNLNKAFGVTYNHMYQFHVNVAVYSFTGKIDLQFAVEMDDVLYYLEIRTPKAYSHVKAGIKGQYWKFCEDWYLSIPDKKKMSLVQITQAEAKKKEAAYQKELQALVQKGKPGAKLALQIRKRYFERKNENPDARIWVTFDKLYKAGDNGEYMYNYIQQQNDGIEIYYIIKEDSLDYERMNTEDSKLLIWGEIDTLVTVLLAEALLVTHTDIFSYVGFPKEVTPYVCDLYNAVNVCIQHGLTVQNIAQYQNRMFDNLHLYTLASPNEFENLSRPIYGFEDKSILKMTGLARYDGLKNNDQKQILITPSWRRSIANAGVAHIKKAHNDFFKNSAYFKVYDRLINDERLIQRAKEKGYKIIYLLHPAVSSQAEDFDANDYVQIIPAASDMNYEKILTESSLMVTDYSGVQFDFAYMRKPILYYHPKELPPHYDESKAYVYERDSFGPIIDNHDALVDALCEYMDNKCTTKPEYVKRADKFFAYNDFDNCKRIYETILDFIDKNQI